MPGFREVLPDYFMRLNKYGTMKLNDVIQPAIDLAENGWPLKL